MATPDMSNALSKAGRLLLQCIESFPVPIEDALWVQTYGNLESAERASRFQGSWEDPRHVANPD